MTLEHIRIEQIAHGSPDAPRLTSSRHQPDFETSDPIKHFAACYGNKVKGSQKTNRRTGYHCCWFEKRVRDYTITTEVTWFQKVQS